MKKFASSKVIKNFIMYERDMNAVFKLHQYSSFYVKKVLQKRKSYLNIKYSFYDNSVIAHIKYIDRKLKKLK